MEKAKASSSTASIKKLKPEKLERNWHGRLPRSSLRSCRGRQAEKSGGLLKGKEPQPLGRLGRIWEACVRKNNKNPYLASDMKVIDGWVRVRWGYSILPHSQIILRQQRQVKRSHNYKLLYQTGYTSTKIVHSLEISSRKKNMYDMKFLGEIGKREYENDVVQITLQYHQFKCKKVTIPKVN